MESEAQLIRRQTEAERKKARAKAEGGTDVGEFLGPIYEALEEDLEELGVEAVEDLKALEQEDVEALAAKLKKVQAKKFARKIASLQA